MDSGKFRPRLIELWNKVTDYVDSKDIHINGDENVYPKKILRVISNSPTGALAKRVLRDFMFGKGALNGGNEINKVTKQTVNELLQEVCEQVAVHYGCFIHVSYEIDEKGDLQPVNPRVISYEKCRISKEDDVGNRGKIYVRDWSEERSLLGLFSKKEKKDWFYPFDSNQKTVRAQIKKDARTDGTLDEIIKDYRGQVFHLNLTPQYVYAVSLFDPVFNDLDTEFRIMQYHNTQVRRGFMGKTAIITNGLDDEDIETDIKDWLGSENSGGVLWLPVENATNLDEVLKIVQVEAQNEDGLFSETKDYIREKVLGAAKNIPAGLVMRSEGLFEKSAELYEELQVFYSQQTRPERSAIETMFHKIKYPIEIEPVAEKKQKSNGLSENI